MHASRALTLTAALIAVTACGRDAESDPSADTARPAVAARCAQDAPPVVTAGGIGPVKLGETVASAECPGQDTTWSREGTTEDARAIRIGGGTVLALTGADDRVSRIIVSDPRYRTERAIGVGSTVGELRRAHGRVCPAVGEGELVISAAQLPGISFATTADVRRIAPAGPASDIEASVVPDSTRITRMWIYDGESLCGGS